VRDDANRVVGVRTLGLVLRSAYGNQENHTSIHGATSFQLAGWELRPRENRLLRRFPGVRVSIRLRRAV
jgi:hypothetical protein